MNEQLTVKNFGPIKDATVNFKRVTVFIGPTGGGKSTLAKLAAIFRNEELLHLSSKETYNQYNLNSHFYGDSSTSIRWDFGVNKLLIEANGEIQVKSSGENPYSSKLLNSLININKTLNELKKEYTINNKIALDKSNKVPSNIEEILLIQKKNIEAFENIINAAGKSNIEITKSTPLYIPSERIFVPAVEYSWAGLMRDDIGLPKNLLDFANSFSTSRKDVLELHIPFFDVIYKHIDGRDFIKIPEREEPLMLLETASGIQSVTPMLVLLEHLSRQKEQAQSFIIEEPELNLYPTAQRDLVYWLLEKCTQGENDLTLTTHSPYVLSALNLALYANKVVTLFPHQHKKVAKLIPEKYWLKAEEFSAYLVSGGGVKSIFDIKTSLLSESQLDEVSGEFADIFDRLTDLRVPDKKTELKAKSVKK